MPLVLGFNPGSNSLKFDLIETSSSQSRAGGGRRLATGTIDDLGKDTSIEITRTGEEPHTEKLKASDFEAATKAALEGIEKLGFSKPDLAAVRVVHGGDQFQRAVRIDNQVLDKIEALKELAPLHNPNAIKVVHAIRQHNDKLPIAAAFDTAFHHTIPEVAWRYPIDKDLADRLTIRKFGFHGISHRYQLEQFCHLTNTPIEEATIITTHLESGSSVCAVRNGKSVETSMGFTPLEGLMMGTRSGSVDPAILPYLMRHENISAEDALNVFEKKSGLLGISGRSLDTRKLRVNPDERSRLALQMYAYRVRATLGAYMAILGEVRGIVLFRRHRREHP